MDSNELPAEIFEDEESLEEGTTAAPQVVDDEVERSDNELDKEEVENVAPLETVPDEPVENTETKDDDNNSDEEISFKRGLVDDDDDDIIASGAVERPGFDDEVERSDDEGEQPRPEGLEADAEIAPEDQTIIEPSGLNKDGDDDEEGGKPILIQDIFGDSESEDEFEGFQKDKDGEQAEGNVEEGAGREGDGDGQEDAGPSGEQKEVTDSSDDDDDRRRHSNSDIVYDFDLMMQRKKEENYRKRKRKNIDIINDSDDVIAELISQMKNAADEDFELNKANRPATSKIKLLPSIEAPLRKIDLREAFLDAGVLGVITDWLTPLPDRSLPNVKVRETMLVVLNNFNISDAERLKASGIGKAVMYLSKHPKETKANQGRAKMLIQKWARFIFNLDADFHSISKEEREQRDFDHMSKAKRHRGDSVSEEVTPQQKGKSGDKNLRPGDKGWVPRARVPTPSTRDYVHRPRSAVDIEMHRGGSSKKVVSRFEQMQRSFTEKNKQSKVTRAVKISIEGRKM